LFDFAEIAVSVGMSVGEMAGESVGELAGKALFGNANENREIAACRRLRFI
jgi:hypothetical protein